MSVPRMRFTIRRMMLAVAVVAEMLTSPGCSADRPSTSVTDSLATQATDDVNHRYDDPRFSPEERRAVLAATEAVLDPARPRPNFDDTYRYDVAKQENGWSVMVFSVHVEDGKPQFAPGASTLVVLDLNFKLKNIIGGE